MPLDKRLLWTLLGLFGVIVLLMLWSFFYDARYKFLSGTAPSILYDEPGKPRLPPLRPADPITGSSDPKAITITVFGDFTCAYCRLSQNELMRALTNIRRPVRVVWRDLPISSTAREAMLNALAGRCAHAQKKFWEWHDAVLTKKYLGEEALREVASSIGLDAPVFDACLRQGAYLRDIQRDVAIAREHLITTPPTFFVGDQPAVSGYVSANQFKRLIEKVTKNP